MQGREKEWVSLWASLTFWTLKPGLGVWTGLTSRDHEPVDGTGLQRKTSTAGPCGLRCQRGQDTGASGVPATGRGPGSWSPSGGALEGRWMWGVTMHGLSNTPTFAIRGKWTGRDRSAGLWTCRRAARLWLGRMACPRPRGLLSETLVCVHPRSKPPRAQGEAASPQPGADSVPPSATRHQQSASVSASPPLRPWLDPGAA